MVFSTPWEIAVAQIYSEAIFLCSIWILYPEKTDQHLKRKRIPTSTKSAVGGLF